MRLATRIIRTPFGMSNAEASPTYPGDRWRVVKDKEETLHRATVGAAITDVPGRLLGVTSGYREHDGRWGIDGREAEWWSVIVYDGPADESCA